MHILVKLLNYKNHVKKLYYYPLGRPWPRSLFISKVKSIAQQRASEIAPIVVGINISLEINYLLNNNL